MKYRLEYISTFHTDIASVTSSLKEYPKMAKRIFEKMDAKLKNLTNLPEMYPIYDDFPDFRKLVIEDYLVFYSINKQAGIIEVHRLIYGRMDVVNQLTMSALEN